MRFTFIYHDGGKIVFDAEDVKHFSGHAVITNGTLIENTEIGKWINEEHPDRNTSGYFKSNLPIGKKFSRFNLALNGHLFGMWPEELDSPEIKK